MRLFYVLLLYFSLINIVQATNGADSILLEIKNANGIEKLEKWSNWVKNADKSNVLVLKNSLPLAKQDAKELLGRDSAILWHFERQGELVSRLSSAQYPEWSIKVLDQMKTTADSISKIEGRPHWTLVEYFYFLGNFHISRVDEKDGSFYFNEALELNKKIKRPKVEFKIYNRLIILYSWQGNTSKATPYLPLLDSLLSAQKFSLEEEMNALFSKSYYYKEEGNYEMTVQLNERILQNSHVLPKHRKQRVQLEYASGLISIGKINEGVKYLEYLYPILEREEAILGNMLTFAEMYTDALILVGRANEAKKWSIKSRNYYYGLQEGRRKDEVQEWQAKYESSEKEAKIQVLEQEKINNQTRLTIISLVALLGIGLLSFLMYRNKNRQKQLALQIEKDQIIAENRDRLFSSITHDIRTPLALMLAPLERAEHNVSNPAVKADINLARRNGKRLMELFNQILDWNKAEAKALNLNPQVGQLDLTFDALTERYEQQAIEKGINFTHDLNIPKGQFLVDYDKMDKILSNLIGNAIKFCEPGQGVNLKVDFEKKGTDHTLNMMVTDQGPGIGEEEQKTLFKRYVQGTQGKLKGGTGIGLALVKELVEMMEGKIELTSELGKGANFNIQLPIGTVEEVHIESKEAQEDYSDYSKGVSTSNPNSEKTLILIVEDEPELLEFLRSALVGDYEVEVANSTTTGLNIAISRIPEVIISDWTLPDNNGGWLCQQIAANELTAHIPVMILTAHNRESYQKEAFDAGAVAWMNKPFNLDTLKRQLHTILMQQKRVQSLWKKREQPDNITDEQVEPIETIDPFLEKVMEVVKENYKNEKYSVEQMASSLFLSRVQLFRKIKSITGTSPSKILNEFRLKKARQILLDTGKPVSEVTYLVGFSDPSYFGKAYKQFFKVSPSQDLGNR